MKNDNNNWLVVGGVLLILVLLFVGYRIIAVSVGPVKVEFAEPNRDSDNKEADLENIENQPSSIQQPAPTLENIDFNSPISLPFSDNFDQGPDSQWRVSGNYLINNGMLAGADKVTLEIGNNTLSSYLVEFEVINSPEYCSWGYNHYLVIGVTPTLQYRAAYSDYYSRGWWYALQNGEWKEIA